MKFDKQCYPCTDLNDFNDAEYFKEYHFWEEHDPEKTYQKGTFSMDFGKGTHTYSYISYTIGLRNKYNEIEKEVKYIVAEEKPSEDELKELEPYCQCPIHTRAWYNPSRYFICGHYVGCLYSAAPRQLVINAARERKEMFLLENKS